MQDETLQIIDLINKQISTYTKQIKLAEKQKAITPSNLLHETILLFKHKRVALEELKDKIFTKFL